MTQIILKIFIVISLIQTFAHANSWITHEKAYSVGLGNQDKKVTLKLEYHVWDGAQNAQRSGRLRFRFTLNGKNWTTSYEDLESDDDRRVNNDRIAWFGWPRNVASVEDFYVFFDDDSNILQQLPEKFELSISQDSGLEDTALAFDEVKISLMRNCDQDLAEDITQVYHFHANNIDQFSTENGNQPINNCYQTYTSGEVGNEIENKYFYLTNKPSESGCSKLTLQGSDNSVSGQIFCLPENQKTMAVDTGVSTRECQVQEEVCNSYTCIIHRDEPKNIDNENINPNWLSAKNYAESKGGRLLSSKELYDYFHPSDSNATPGTTQYSTSKWVASQGPGSGTGTECQKDWVQVGSSSLTDEILGISFHALYSNYPDWGDLDATEENPQNQRIAVMYKTCEICEPENEKEPWVNTSTDENICQFMPEPCKGIPCEILIEEPKNIDNENINPNWLSAKNYAESKGGRLLSSKELYDYFHPSDSNATPGTTQYSTQDMWVATYGSNCERDFVQIGNRSPIGDLSGNDAIGASHLANMSPGYVQELFDQESVVGTQYESSRSVVMYKKCNIP